MLQDDRSNASANHVLADGLTQQARDVLMRFSGKLAKLFPRGFVDFGADLDGDADVDFLDVAELGKNWQTGI